MPNRTEQKLKRLINITAFLVATTVGIAIPSLYFIANYRHEVGSVDTLAQVQSSMVSQRVDTTTGRLQITNQSLSALVNDHVRDHEGTQVHIFDNNRIQVATSSTLALNDPILSKEVRLYSGSKPVGYLRVERSLSGLFSDTLSVIFGGILLALLIAIPLRTLPLRAIRRSEKELEHATNHDALTGLPNRTLLNDRLKQSILNAQRYGRSVTVMVLDLDNFKNINDSLGHAVGDELLKTTAERLLQSVRKSDTVVRLGGDEFVIVFTDQTSDTPAITLAIQKIRDAITEPFDYRGHTLRVTCSMGLATFPNDGEDAASLMKNADAAMYRAKELGRNNFQFFTAEMNQLLQERLTVQQGLLQALANEEFKLVYQPQVDLKTGKIVGVETLLRWEHPELGMVSPAKFIPVAEDTGMIVPIGEWVLRTACKQNKEWQDMGFPAIKMSVNVSPRQFKERNWANIVANALSDSGLAAEYLELEITEGLIMENVERAVQVMRELQDMGVQLSIDDFGTGYSSLSSLKHFPVARLKIDQSFIRGLPGSNGDQSIAMAVIALGHNLNLKVIAEGVETEQQQEFLRQNMCDEMQGYYFSKPVPPSEVERLFTRAALLSA